jgi:hypothetical protein
MTSVLEGRQRLLSCLKGPCLTHPLVEQAIKQKMLRLFLSTKKKLLG